MRQHHQIGKREHRTDNRKPQRDTPPTHNTHAHNRHIGNPLPPVVNHVTRGKHRSTTKKRVHNPIDALHRRTPNVTHSKSLHVKDRRKAQIPHIRPHTTPTLQPNCSHPITHANNRQQGRLWCSHPSHNLRDDPNNIRRSIEHTYK